MSIISACPKCNHTIQLSEEWSDPSAEFRCPRCKAAFKLHEALDRKAESPPEALPATPVPLTPSTPEAAIKQQSAANAAAMAAEGHGPIRSSAASAARRRSRGPNPLWSVVGIVGGGVLGIYIGAYCLMRFGVDLPEPVNQLPGIEYIRPGIAANPDTPPEENTAPPDTVEPEPTPPVAANNTEETPLVTPTPTTPTPVPTPPVELPPPKTPVVQGAPFVPLDDLSQIIRETNLASGGGIGQSSTPKLDNAVYQKLCHLAHSLTFADASLSELGEKRHSTTLIVQRVGKSQQFVLGELGSQTWSQAKHLQGIVLVGTVRSITPEGPLQVVRLEMDTGGKSVMVVCKILSGLKVGGRFAILGAVVESPAETLKDYSGQLPRVVWCGLPVSLR